MTNEEAIIHIRDILAENNSIKPSMVVFESEKEALRVAIKALEQEDVLDKIRAEIEQKARPNEISGRGNGKSIRYGLFMALEIIDKYKAEGEEV